MASPITHFIVGAALAFPLAPRWGAIAAAGLIAVAPDFDIPIMALFPNNGGPFFGHRGIFHAPFFLAVATSILAWRTVEQQRVSVAVAWTAAAISHPLLDALTDSDVGVMLLFPFTDARMFFPWRPIFSTPADVILFLHRAGDILISELPFVIAAVTLGVAAKKLVSTFS